MAGAAPARGFWRRGLHYAEPSRTCPGEPFDWQKQFHASPARFKGFSGPVGSGKIAGPVLGDAEARLGE